MNKDPWAISDEDANAMKNQTKGGAGTGVFCPKRNISIGSPCRVCDALQPLWDFPKGSKERDTASNKSAKVSYFLNIVLSSNKEKSLVLELGKKAGDYILNSIYDPDMNWKMVAHPLSGKGFDVKIKKQKGDLGFNAYNTFKGEVCDWDVPKSVLDNLTDISQAKVIEMLTNGTLVEGENFFRITSLKLDETLTFRICPPWDHKTGGKFIITPVFRHWKGVTQAEVDGTVSVNLSAVETEVEDSGTEKQTADVPWKDDAVETKSTTTRKACFGAIDPAVFYDSDDDDCKSCGSAVMELCSKEVAKNQKRKLKEQL